MARRQRSMESETEKIEIFRDQSSKCSNFTNSSSSSDKRLKTLAPTLSLISGSKGREMMDEIKFRFKEEEEQQQAMDSDSKTCGICLSEDGNKIRGWVDSCDHYFCYVCIMEWAKVESRCPMCKQRFNFIRRPPKNGVFPQERIVNVPIRDQVYHGNETSESFDPYAEVECSECHSTKDENLLLLCDLCDSAAHTYCVGLGNTVPEGDWYCHDCNESRKEHSDRPLDSDFHSKSFSRNIDSDIVREFRTPDPNARTLYNCRNVHRHIRALRENWGALRSGSLGFSSSSNKKSVSIKDVNNIDKAWKMMGKAKSALQACQNSKIDHQHSIRLFGTVIYTKEATLTKSSILEDEPFRHKHMENIVLKRRNEMGQEKHKSHKLEEEELKRENVERSKFDEEHQSNGRHLSTRSVLQSKSSRRGFDSFCRSSGSRVEPTMGKHTVEKNPAVGIVGKDDDVKCEIQSLVKLNLMLMSRDKNLGANEFKEIARYATHTILAACGLEHKKKLVVRPVSNEICTHSESVIFLRPSKLISNSCISCFYAFARDVVESIMLSQLAHTSLN